MNKDCIMKKVKSRFFKYFANKYMIIFANYLNNQLIYPFDEKVFFYRLNNYFIKDATIKRHKEWKFVDKSILELFHDHSDMKLKEIADIFIHDKEKAENKIRQIIESTLKVPVLKYNRDMLDTLHFFVYNTHNLFMYNFRTRSYRSYVVNIKIPANFMSVENEEGRIFLTGGGEPGKATKFCYEFMEERLV